MTDTQISEVLRRHGVQFSTLPGDALAIAVLHDLRNIAALVSALHDLDAHFVERQKNLWLSVNHLAKVQGPFQFETRAGKLEVHVLSAL